MEMRTFKKMKYLLLIFIFCQIKLLAQNITLVRMPDDYGLIKSEVINEKKRMIFLSNDSLINLSLNSGGKCESFEKCKLYGLKHILVLNSSEENFELLYENHDFIIDGHMAIGYIYSFTKNGISFVNYEYHLFAFNKIISFIFLVTSENANECKNKIWSDVNLFEWKLEK